ncbi:3-oxo-5-alpha-steroid 4-dehydrogenase-domain-containing protein [Phycomyces nitens]|nr:3-oxo-5-alpha-steroid 4-dehydrogenase-domain-containing protein [Phycomyces nitens]
MYYPTLDTFSLSLYGCALLVTICLPLRELDPETRMGYSKFAVPSKQAKLPSRIGMLFIYSPALAASIFSFLYAYSKSMNTYIILCTALCSLHYIKRVCEATMLHHYSGTSFIRDVLIISTSYLSFTLAVFYFSTLVPVRNRVSNEVLFGVILFFFGEGLNHYHHRILADLRKDGSKEYKIPRKGLFQYLWCPHYLGEIIGFFGVALVSQSFIIVAFQISSTAYLLARSHNTRKWYESRFPNAPRRACVIPNIF